MSRYTLLLIILAVTSTCKRSDQTNAVMDMKPIGKIEDSFNLSSCAIDRNKLLIGKSGNVSSYDLDDSLRIGATYSIQDKLDCKPFALADLLIVTADASVFCFRNGKLLWKRQFRDRIKANVIVNDGKLYLQARGEGVYCLNTETGENTWVYNSAEGTIGGLLVSQSAVLISGLGEKVIALNKETGVLSWERSHKGFILSDIDTSDNYFVLNACNFSNQDSSFVGLFRVSDGGEVFKKKYKINCRYRPIISGSKIFTATEESKIISLASDDGHLLWECSLPSDDNVATNFLILGNEILFGSINRSLYAVNENSGVIVTKRDFQYGLSELLRANDHFYFLEGNGTVYRY
jgi:outer membrane protein assembly factor BamB